MYNRVPARLAEQAPLTLKETTMGTGINEIPHHASRGHVSVIGG